VFSTDRLSSSLTGEAESRSGCVTTPKRRNIRAQNETLMSEQAKLNPYTILAFCFTPRDKADEVMKELKAAKTLEANQVIAAAIVEMDDFGKAKVHQHGRGGVGAAVGIMAGEALALLGGPAGLLAWAAVGGAVGGAAGHFVDRAFTKADLAKLKDQMPPDSSAILTMAKDAQTAGLITAMQSHQAVVVTLALGEEASGAVDQSVAAEASDAASAEKSA
jgi:uncharacterized membrane protein